MENKGKLILTGSGMLFNQPYEGNFEASWLEKGWTGLHKSFKYIFNIMDLYLDHAATQYEKEKIWLRKSKLKHILKWTYLKQLQSNLVRETV